MLKFVVLLCAVACALGAAIPDGMLPQLDGRIVGGDSTDISSLPYQTSIQRNGRHHCGGCVSSRKYIVTAAHCMQSYVSAYMVRVGSSSCNSGGVLISVDSYINHEGYNSRTMVNDISVIRLSSSLIWSDVIQPIALAITAPANGAAAIVSGWGNTSSGGSSPTQLRSVKVDILERSLCNSTEFGYGNEIEYGMICAYAVGKDSCQGDSGGPLACDGVLAGVVSWGYGCADPKFPGIYTDIAVYHAWIEDNTSDV